MLPCYCQNKKKNDYIYTYIYVHIVEETAQFENDLLLLIKNLEFKKVHNDFQMKLRDDIKEIKASNKVFVSADKSRHIYKMEKDESKKLLQDNITYIKRI